MFEVYALGTNDIYMVYGVRPVLSLNGIILQTEFLIYRYGNWSWENSKEYEPKL
jgi:hypothetical protein